MSPRGWQRAISSRSPDESISSVRRAVSPRVEAPQHLPDLRGVVGPGWRNACRDDRPAFDEFELDALAGFTFLRRVRRASFRTDRSTPRSCSARARAHRGRKCADPAVVVE